MPKWWEGVEKLAKNKSKKELQEQSTTDILNHQNETPPITGNNTKPESKERIMADPVEVTMEDGRVETFGARKKMIKNTEIDAAGNITTRLSFSNGKVITFTMPTEMKDRFASFGADQKFGDNIAGLDDVEDCILATEQLAERLMNGEWSMKRESSGMGGTSILVRALVEHTGKTVDKIKEFLAQKSQAEKLALRNNTRIKPIIDRLEAEKAAGKAGVDTDAMLDELA